MAGGLYEVPVRAPGTLITALIYNADHQRHVDGRAADIMQALGVTLGQMNLVEDPFPGGVESFAPSLAGEVTRLRFEIAQFKRFLAGNTAVNWWVPITGAAPAIVGARVQRVSSQSIPTGANTKVDFTGGTATFNNPLTAPGPVWDSAANQTRFTAPFDGLYLAFASIVWQPTGPSLFRTRRIQIGVNNTFSSNPVVSNAVRTSVPVDPHAQAITGLLDLTAGDFVEFRVFQDNGSALPLLGQAEQSIVGGLVFFGSHP